MTAAALPSRAPLTIAELAARWMQSEDDIRALISAGLVASTRIGPQRRLVLPADADKYERHAIRGEMLERDIVYFVHAPRSDLIKIGRAEEARSRWQCLKSMNSEPLAMLALCPSADREREFHNRFAMERHHGEWFVSSRRLVAFTQKLRSTFGLPTWAEQ